MKSVLLVSNTSWYLYNFRLSIIKLFQQQGFNVICIANEDAYSAKLISQGVTFIASTLKGKGMNPLYEMEYLYFLYKTYKKINPSFIFHYTVKPNIYGSHIAHLLKIKSIAVVSGAGYVFLRNNTANAIIKKMYKRAAKRCEEIWFVNEEDRRMFLKEGVVNDKQITKVLPGEGINVDLFKRDEPFNIDSKSFIFLFSGRMLWDKGVGYYVEAAKKIKLKYQHAQFQLLGFLDVENPSAISKAQIEEWEKSGYVKYLGETDNVRKYLSKIHCFVLPSFYREGVPKSLLEAASLEIPIITTDNVGCREVVEDGYNGFLCEVKDTESLVEKMEQMITMDRLDLMAMGKNGRVKIENEFKEEFVLKFYKEVISKTKTEVELMPKGAN